MPETMLEIIIAAALASAPTAPAIYGYGADSCGQWLESRERGGINGLAAASWLAGYVSAIGVTEKRDALNGRRLTDAEYWIDNYCRDNPQRRIVLAAEAMLAAFRRP